MKTRYSEEEKTRLRKLVVAYKSAIENRESDAWSLQNKKRAWEKITEVFNASGRHPPRTREQLKKLWDNIKFRMKHGVATKKQAWLEDGVNIVLNETIALDATHNQSTASTKTKRRLIFSKEEKMRLRDLLMAYQPIIENKKSDSRTLLEKKQAWSRITAQFNCSGMPPRTTAQLKKLRENIKFRTKRGVANGKRFWERTEEPNTVHFSDNSQQNIMTVTTNPSCSGSTENQVSVIADDLRETQDQLRELEIKEAQLKITKLEKEIGHDEELFALLKKKLGLEIGLLELQMTNEKAKSPNVRVCYNEL